MLAIFRDWLKTNLKLNLPKQRFFVHLLCNKRMNRKFLLDWRSFIICGSSTFEPKDNKNIRHNAEQSKKIERHVALGLNSNVFFGQLS